MSIRLPYGEYVSNIICASRVNIMVYMFDAFNSHLQIEYVRRVNIMVYMFYAFYRDHSFTTCA